MYGTPKAEAIAEMSFLNRLTLKSWTGLIFLLAAAAVILMPPAASATTPTTRVFDIEASSFAFDPGIIDVNLGDQIIFNLTATDVVHGLYIDDYGLMITADPGQTETLRFVADKSGSFRFRCSTSCGSLHPFMIGKLRVGQNRLMWQSISLALLVAAAGLWRWRQ